MKVEKVYSELLGLHNSLRGQPLSQEIIRSGLDEILRLEQLLIQAERKIDDLEYEITYYS